jgi:glycosyltransferase involved in cell wall biosynthesis
VSATLIHLRALARAPLAYVWTLIQMLVHRGDARLSTALVAFGRGVRLARAVERRRIERVHALGADEPALAGVVLRNLTGVAFSLTALGPDLRRARARLGWILGQTDLGVALCEHDREFVRDQVGRAAAAKLRVIHRGVGPTLRARSSEPTGPDFELLCIAPLCESEGHRHLIDACGLLAVAAPRIRCHLVGSGPLESELRARIERAGLGERVVLHGELPHAAVLELLSGAHAVVSPLTPERAGQRAGIPVSLLEGMSCACPWWRATSRARAS